MSEQLKYKLSNYEVKPPPGAWENIATELKDGNELLPLSQRLYDYEIAPPPLAWKTIASALVSDDNETNIVPVKKFRVPVLKIMAAAAFLGVIMLGTFYFYNNGLKKKQISGNQPFTSPKNKNQKAIISKDKSSPPAEKLLKVLPQIGVTAFDLAPNKAKKNFHRPNNRLLRNTIVKNVRSIGSELGILIAARPIRNEKGDIIQNPALMNSPGNNYINITGPNGQQTRISSKFVNALMYINGDSDIESFEGFFDKSFLESLIWKTRFQDWRKKISQTSFIPSSTNFLDILEFKDLIMKENQ